jgi:transposase
VDRASLEQLLGQGLSLAEIGRRFGLHESTVGYWVEKHGLQAINRGKHVARGGIARGELEVLVEEGRSISQIAEAVGRGKATVRHWLTEYGLKTNRAVQRNTLLETEQQIGGVVMRECPHHGLTEFKRRSAGGHRCLKCRSDAVTRRRRKVKQILVRSLVRQLSCRGGGWIDRVDAAGFRLRRIRPEPWSPSGVAQSGVAQLADALDC